MASVFKNGMSRATASSFGADDTTLGPEFGARNVLLSERTRKLEARQSIYECTNHDWKRHDFDGNLIINEGPRAGAYQPLLSTMKAPYYVSFAERRPTVPYRLGKLIVDAMTNMVYAGGFPQIKAPGDESTEAFANALAKAARLPVKAIRARNLAGSVGTVCASWRFKQGKPRVSIHNAKHCYVHAWEDREELIPRHVTKIYRYVAPRWDDEKQQVVDKWFWYRRDWTQVADIVFKTIEYDPEIDPVWEIDEEASKRHGDGFAHFVWSQNVPNEEDIDGFPDYEGVEPNLDDLDVMNSLMSRALKKNLDPTLVLSMEVDVVARQGVIQKGSDNAIAAGPNGDAKYLEMTGTSVTVGAEKLKTDTKQTLAICQTVLTDPETMAADGTSSVALRLIFGPMTKAASIRREQQGDMFTRLLEQMVSVAQVKMGKTTGFSMGTGGAAPEGAANVSAEDAGGDEPDAGAESGERVEFKLDLPKREVPVAPVDDEKESGDPAVDGQAAASEQGESGVAPVLPQKPKTMLVDHDPGVAEKLGIEWAEFFPDTPADIQAKVTTITAAAGGVAVISPQTATEEAATAFGRDPAEEWSRMQSAQKEQEKKQADMFAQAGGPVGGGGGPPGKGAPPFGGKKPGAPPFGKKPGAPPFGGKAGAPPPAGDDEDA